MRYLGKKFLLLINLSCLATDDRVKKIDISTFKSSELTPNMNCQLRHLTRDLSEADRQKHEKVIDFWRYVMAEYYAAMYNSYVLNTSIVYTQSSDGLMRSSQSVASLEEARAAFLMMSRYFQDLTCFSADKTIAIQPSQAYNNYIICRNALTKHAEEQDDTKSSVNIKYFPKINLELHTICVLPGLNGVIVTSVSYKHEASISYEEFLQLVTTSNRLEDVASSIIRPALHIFTQIFNSTSTKSR